MLKKQNGQFHGALHLISSFVTHCSYTKNMVPCHTGHVATEITNAFILQVYNSHIIWRTQNPKSLLPMYINKAQKVIQ